MRVRHAIPVLLAAAALGGCGIKDPYNDNRGRPPATTTTSAATTPELPAAPAAITEGIGRSALGRLKPADLSRTRARTIERYADFVGTWTWQNIGERYRAAARLALGPARARVLASVREVPSIAAYREREIRQATRIEAIVPHGPSSDGPTYLVVMERRIELNDSPPSKQWFIALATLRRVGDRWAVIRWEDLV